MKKIPYLLIIVFGFLATQSAMAGVEHNISGFAWSENIGWISFNSLNCDTDNNGQSNGGTGCPAAGTAISNYGINIDDSGIFSGYAWSENIGWISFNRLDTGTPPVAPYNGSETYIAKVDLTTKEVSGWGRALAFGGGWDGWIKFRGTNYGVNIDISVSPSEFRNWAWADNFPVVGWISFNCSNQGACGASNYKVIIGFSSNQAPQANSLSVEYQSYCDVFAGQGQVSFIWTYQDADADPETRFDFRVNDTNNVNNANPEIDRSFTGLNNPDGTVNTQSVLVESPLEADKIEFNKTYYWWVRVYDDKGTDSGWVAGSSFATVNHAYPWVDFDWSPENPRVNELTSFENQSIVYTAGLVSNYWTFQDGSPVNSSGQNPLTSFTSLGQKQITLQVTDSDGYSCSASKFLGTQIPLPDWKEIIPFSKIWDFLAGISQKTQVFFKNLDLGYFVR